MQDRIEYETLVQKALRNVIRDVLADVAVNGLPGEHHFYITFYTQKPGVQISNRLKERFPETMTIVLQHRFWDMELLDNGFTVTLSFDGIAEKLVIPFSAMQLFYDPTAAFEVAFNADEQDSDDKQAITDETDESEVADDEETHNNESEIVAFPPKASDEDQEHTGPAQHLHLPKNFIDALNKTDYSEDKSNEKETSSEEDDKTNSSQGQETEHGETEEKKDKSARVVSLDAFRKK